MSGDEWAQVESLFHRAAEMPADARCDWVRAECQGNPVREQFVLRMLAADAVEEDHIQQSVGVAAESWLEVKDNPPERLGSWRIVRPIGAGGMGTVYPAARADAEFEKLAAVKILKHDVASPRAREKFLVERQILAELDHPQIAGLLDGGSTPDGRPYLVMEYVDGVPLIDHCRNLELRDRCRLFAAVCDAVAYAHQRLIVHRDLKPANILVDRTGSPKLLDFGIAKLLGANAAPSNGQTEVMFTADYASPEQLHGQPVTTATDVYALGTILYELIAGQPPHNVAGGSFAELVGAVCDRDVTPPSRKSASPVPEDLDNIVLKAMARDPEARYRTAYEFAGDVRNYLEDRPVLARGKSWTYVARKFARRHAAALGIVAVLVAALIASTIWSLRAAGEAARQRARAEERAEQLRSLNHDLLFKVQSSLDGVVGATKARQMLVQTALDQFEREMREGGGNEAIRRDLAVAYRRIGDVQGFPRNPSLGDLAGAEASYRRSLELQNTMPADWQWHIDRMLTLVHLADTVLASGRWEMAAGIYRQAIDAAPADEGTVEQRVQRTMRLMEPHQLLSQLYMQKSKLEEARLEETRGRELLDQGLRLAPGDAALLRTRVVQRIRTGYLMLEQKKGQEAIREADLGIRETQQLLANSADSLPRLHDLMLVYTLRADARSRKELPEVNYESALADLDLASGIATSQLQAEPTSTRTKYEISLLCGRQSAVLYSLRRYAESLKTAEHCLTFTDSMVSAQPDNAYYLNQHGDSHFDRANALSGLNRPGEAIEEYQIAVRTLRRVVATQSNQAVPVMLDSLERIGDLERKRSDPEAAASAYREGLQLFREHRAAAGEDHRNYESRLTAKLR